MKKFLTLVLTLILASSASFAAKIPEDVREYILNKVPNTDIRFDGVVILPDNTVYLPLFPSLFSDVTSLKVKTSYPENKELNQKPDVLIFNNDFVLMKVLTDSNGNNAKWLRLRARKMDSRSGRSFFAFSPADGFQLPGGAAHICICAQIICSILCT